MYNNNRFIKGLLLASLVSVTASAHADLQMAKFERENLELKTQLSNEELSDIRIDGALEATAAGSVRSLPASPTLIKSRKLEGHQKRFKSALTAEYPEAERRLRAAFKAAQQRKQEAGIRATPAELERVINEDGGKKVPAL